jgi:hypothetical protein
MRGNSTPVGRRPWAWGVLLLTLAGLLLPTVAWAGVVQPTIEGMTATNQTATGAAVTAQIDPQGSETTWEIRLQCGEPYPGPIDCEKPVDGLQPNTGKLAAGTTAQTVSAEFTGLHAGYVYSYVVTATNAAGTSEKGQVFQTLPAGSVPNGTYIEPYRSNPSEVGLSGSATSKEGLERVAAWERATREQAEREAAARRAAQPPPAVPPSPAGTLSLTASTITVQGGVAQIPLECLGAGACTGALTLTTTIAVSHHRRARTATTTTSCALAGDEERTIMLTLTSPTRELLLAHHGLLPATLTLKQPAGGPQTIKVRLRRAALSRHRRRS